jgi:hypothetical protein
VGLLIATVAPYLVGYCIYQWQIHLLNTGKITLSPDYRQDLAGCAFFGLLLTIGVSAAFGGNSFASERRERWAEFLAMTPAPRWQIILSKLLVSVGCLAAAWLIHVRALDSGIGWQRDGVDRELAMEIFPVLAISVFCVSFCLSTFLESAAIAASIAIGVVVATAVTIAMNGPYTDLEGQSILVAICAAGPLVAAAGVVYYARRVAP